MSSDLINKVSRLIEENLLIAKVTFENSSYLKLGGYNGKLRSAELNIMETLRPSEVKGFLRWWYRAIYACLKIGKNYREIEEEYVNDVLGSTRAQSLIRLETSAEIEDGVDEKITELCKDKSKEICKSKKGIKKYICSKLNDSYKPHKFKGTIKLYFNGKKSLDYNQIIRIMVAVIALILALIFEGIGASSSRGFAGVKLLTFNVNKNAIISALSEKNRASEVERHISDLENRVNRLITASTRDELRSAIEELLNFVANLIGCRINLQSIPFIPTVYFSQTWSLLRFCAVVVPKDYPIVCLLQDIDDAIHKGRRSAQEFFGNSWLTRKSAIRLTIFENNNNRFLIISGFLFRDVRKEYFNRAFDAVCNFILNRFRGGG